MNTIQLKINSVRHTTHGILHVIKNNNIASYQNFKTFS